MSGLVFRRRTAPSPSGLLLSVTRESAGWSYVGFDVYRLSRGMTVQRAVEGQEVCAVVLGGKADMSYGSSQWADVGRRDDVFSGAPDAVYAPPGEVLTIAATSAICEVALCWAPAKHGVEPKRLPASGVKPFTRGVGRTQRTIHDILMLAEPAESLLVTEVLTPGGNWSSWPPRKHDTNDLPRESYLEETYYHRTALPEGFAVQTVYTDDRSLDEAVQVHDGDLVLVPRGYHFVAAGPGYDLYYLNVMAGPHRAWVATTDPDHEARANPDAQPISARESSVPG